MRSPVFLQPAIEGFAERSEHPVEISRTGAQFTRLHQHLVGEIAGRQAGVGEGPHHRRIPAGLDMYADAEDPLRRSWDEFVLPHIDPYDRDHYETVWAAVVRRGPEGRPFSK